MEGDFIDEIEKAVQEIESCSSVEVVVSLHQTSGGYRDLDLLWGLLFGLSLLSYKIWSPYHFHPDWIPLNVLLCTLLGFFLSARFGAVRRLFLRPIRRNREVLRNARAEFVRLGVGGTSGRTGLLVYLSRFERSLVLIPDSGLREAIVPKLWEEWNHKFGSASSDDRLLANLKELLVALKGPLSRQLPRQDDDINELPDRPVEAS